MLHLLHGMKALFSLHFRVSSSECRTFLKYGIAREFGLSTLGSGEQGALLDFSSEQLKENKVFKCFNFLLFIVPYLCSSEVFSYLEYIYF